MDAFIGLISDTHGLLRAEAVAALRGAALIIHAGDVGKPAVLDALREIAPVVAVRGNVDAGEWAEALPETATVEACGARLHVTHDIAALAIDPVAAAVQAVVHGHSHKPGWRREGSVLYVNPGSAGPRRFSLPIGLARLRNAADGLTVEFVTLDVRR